MANLFITPVLRLEERMTLFCTDVAVKKLNNTSCGKANSMDPFWTTAIVFLLVMEFMKVFEPKNVAATNLGYEDVDGIRWNDGNKWIVKSQSFVKRSVDGNKVMRKPMSIAIGEGFFLSYVGFSCLAGAYGLVKGIQQKQQDL